MSNKSCKTWFITCLNTQWQNRAIRFSSLLGAGMAMALGIFSLTQLVTDTSGSTAVSWHLPSLILDKLSWLMLKLPVDFMAFVLCRPEYTYGCVSFYGMMYALFVGMPLLLVIWIIFSGFLGLIVGGWTGFLFNRLFCRMKR